MSRRVRSITLGVALGVAVLATTSARERLGFHHASLDLPGPPAKVIPADFNADGRMDLLVVVVYTEIESIGEHRIEEMVQVTTVIPAAFDRREARVYLARPDGSYLPAGPPLELPVSTLHMEPGPPGLPVIALTDSGLAEVRFDSAGDAPGLRFLPLVEEPPFLARTESFYASLALVHDLNGDGIDDVLLPARESLDVHLGTGSGLEATPADRLDLRRDAQRSERTIRREMPFPHVRDIDGDGIADLFFPSTYDLSHRGRRHVLLGSSDGEFRPLRDETLDCHDTRSELRLAAAESDAAPSWPQGLLALRDLDGVGRAEAVFRDEKDRGDGMRKELKDAKRPLSTYRFHRLDEQLAIEPDPYFTLDVVGHAMEAGDEDAPFSVDQFEDLDGNGREELITITLDFSIFQALKVLTTKRIGVGLEFHVYAQHADGTFREVRGLDLTEKLKLDLNNLKVGRFAQFAGDFDGDGRQDFAHFGRGKTVTLHAGQPGSVYPKKPDLSVELEEEPASLDLVRVEDLDGDGRSDLRITRPLAATDADASAPVRLDLYLSGGAE